jgi:hypothetical protein
MDTNHTTSLSTEKTTAGPAPTHGQGGEASEHEGSQDKPGQDGGGVKTESHLLRPLGCGLLGTGIGGLAAIAVSVAQHIPTHIGAQLFAAHAGGGLDNRAMVRRDPVQSPRMHHRVRGKAERPGQGGDAASGLNGALKSGVF